MELDVTQKKQNKNYKKSTDLLASLSKTLEDTLIIVSADHGLIDVENKTYLNEYPQLSIVF